ncbi:MAG TPA: sugar ABC transporter permease [Devosia sp.]|mgnify:CR=1 FL=1|nr:sugar ABC transporter permease [Devosia sp.]
MATIETSEVRKTRAPARKSTGYGPVGNTRLLAYGLLTPAVLCVAFLLAYPLYLVFQLAFNDGAGMNFMNRPIAWGIENFRVVLGDNRTWAALVNTAVYTSGSIIPSFLFGLGLALLLNRSFPARRWFRSLILLPWAVPGVIVSIVFLWMFDTSFGVVNAMLRNVGLIEDEIRWYTSRDMAMFSVIMPTIWKGFPFFTLTLLAALQSIPASLYEAAEIDGASKVQKFFHVTWPGIRGAAVLVTILQTLWVFREFDIIFATTGGGPVGATETIGLLVYNEAFDYFRIGTASAAGVLMLALAIGIILLALKPLKKEYF